MATPFSLDSEHELGEAARFGARQPTRSGVRRASSNPSHENLGTYHKNESSHRRWCKTCGGHVLTEHPAMGLTDVYAAVIKGFKFEPHLHVNYGEAVVRVHDGLPKQKDFPAEMGGSGTILPE